MPEKLVMPMRELTDGPIGISREQSRLVRIHAATGGVSQDIVCSEYNAWRLLGSLSLFLGVPLSKEAQRAVKL